MRRGDTREEKGVIGIKRITELAGEPFPGTLTHILAVKS
jgi:hypothetical protein